MPNLKINGLWYYTLMSGLTTDEILHLSRLANLTLSKKETTTLKDQLSDVINYFKELKKLRTDDVSPTSQTTGLEDVLREDQVDATTDKTHNGAFVVPQVIDKDL